MGDFDSKSQEWGQARLDERGILVGEMIARNDLIVLNWGRDFTFRQEAVGGQLSTSRLPRPVLLKDRRLVRPRGNNLV